MSENLKIVLGTSPPEQDTLDVNDALNQLRDFFMLLDSGRGISWRITFASKNSPLTLGFEPFSERYDPALFSAYAKEEKREFENNMVDLLEGRMPFMWANNKHKGATDLLQRINERINKFEIDFCDELPPIEVTPQSANFAYKKISFHKRDLSRREIGSIDGHISDIGVYYNRPAIQVFDRLRQTKIWCVVPNDHIDIIAESSGLRDVWEKQRVRVSGDIYYDKVGGIAKLIVSDFEKINPRKIAIQDIMDADFTGGLTPSEYLSSMEEA